MQGSEYATLAPPERILDLFLINGMPSVFDLLFLWTFIVACFYLQSEESCMAAAI